MPTILLGFLLLAATVDPRLAEPLRLLAELHDASGEPHEITLERCTLR